MIDYDYKGERVVAISKRFDSGELKYEELHILNRVKVETEVKEKPLWFFAETEEQQVVLGILFYKGFFNLGDNPYIMFSANPIVYGLSSAGKCRLEELQ